MKKEEEEEKKRVRVVISVGLGVSKSVTLPPLKGESVVHSESTRSRKPWLSMAELGHKKNG